MLPRVGSNPVLPGTGFPSAPMLPRSNSAPLLPGSGPMMPPPMSGSFRGPPGMGPMPGSFMGGGPWGSVKNTMAPNPLSGIFGIDGGPRGGPVNFGSLPPTRPGEVLIEVSRLLDMPIQTRLLMGDMKQYRVRAYDEDDYELARTCELAGIVERTGESEEALTETIRLGSEGVLRFMTESPIIFLQVEYAGGFVGNTKIGRCRIHRRDPRSSQVWSYVLNDRRGESVGSGIELKVVDVAAPLVPPQSSMRAMPYEHTLPPEALIPPEMPPVIRSGVEKSFRDTMPFLPPGSRPFDVTSFRHEHPEPGVTRLTRGAVSGDHELHVEHINGFNIGDIISIGDRERMPIVNFNSIIIGEPLRGDYGPGTTIRKVAEGGSMFPGFNRDQGHPMQGFHPSSAMSQLDDIQHFETPKVDSALINGKNLTELMNNLIDSNGFKDPTGGKFARDVFREDGFLEVKKGSTPLRFPQGFPPPYDLSPLFMAQPGGSNTLMPSRMPGMPPMMMLPPTAGSLGAPRQGHAPTLAVIEVDKITGLPAPPDGIEKDVFISLHRDKDGRELDKKGPFRTERNKTFRQVLLQGQDLKLLGKCSMEELAEGGLKVWIRSSYKDEGFLSTLGFGAKEKLGDTLPFMVTWTPEQEMCHDFVTDQRDTVGGIFCRHGLRREEEVMKEMRKARSASVERSPRMKGGDFARNADQGPKKTPMEEKVEAAALALEAQNRAFLQRIKIADPKNCQDDNQFMRTNEKGYREWSDLDSLFITMGPNYVAQSNEIGPSICRVYEDDTSIWRELMQKDQTSPEALDYGGNGGGGDSRATKIKLIQTVYPGDPEKIQSTLRPLICRDREDIKYDEAELLSGRRSPEQQSTPVKVTIKKAVRLRDKASFHLGSVKPKVIVEVGGKPKTKKETRASPDHHAPEWNQILDVFGWVRGDDLKFTVADAGWLGFDEHLGEFRLKTGDFYPAPFRGEVPLTNAGSKGNRSVGSNQAKLAIEVRVMSAGQQSKVWPPVQPMYAPVQNLNQADQETQRLANWAPAQCAKLSFADVNPNYQINEDIWGAMADTKATNELLKPKPPGWKPPRVKDSCLMA